MMLHSCEKTKAMILVMVGMTIVMTMVLSIPMIRAETFDIKATLLKHREQHTNHLNVSFHVLTSFLLNFGLSCVYSLFVLHIYCFSRQLFRHIEKCCLRSLSTIGPISYRKAARRNERS